MQQNSHILLWLSGTMFVVLSIMITITGRVTITSAHEVASTIGDDQGFLQDFRYARRNQVYLVVPDSITLVLIESHPVVAPGW